VAIGNDALIYIIFFKWYEDGKGLYSYRIAR